MLKTCKGLELLIKFRYFFLRFSLKILYSSSKIPKYFIFLNIDVVLYITLLLLSLSLLYKLNLSMDFRISSEIRFLIFKIYMYSNFYCR